MAAGDLILNPATRTVRRNEEEITLTAKEYALLEGLMRRPSTTLTRTILVEHCWDLGTSPGSNVVDAHIKALRDKIDRLSTAPRQSRPFVAPATSPSAASASPRASTAPPAASPSRLSSRPSTDLVRELASALPIVFVLATIGAYLLAAAALRPVERMRTQAAAVTEATPATPPNCTPPG
ncbi:winged helix-turn-helix domain-containing protein [Streptomyces sp. NPDC001276]|uniref:winged helix-turn-helix domain-containing protein n=1 Tax=Streptomyces sp. NPDC001276 TaxID=3364555 RepID=UPI0036AC72A7